MQLYVPKMTQPGSENYLVISQVSVMVTTESFGKPCTISNLHFFVFKMAIVGMKLSIGFVPASLGALCFACFLSKHSLSRLDY
jgi:hypothetical protein